MATKLGRSVDGLINVDFDYYISKLNNEVEIYKNDDKIFCQLEDIKADLLSINSPIKEDILQQLLSEINSTFSFLKSTGYSGNVINELIEYIIEILKNHSFMSVNQLENIGVSSKNNSILPALNSESENLISAINAALRNTVDDVVARILKDNVASLEISSKSLYDNIKSLINKSLISLSDDILNHLTILARSVENDKQCSVSSPAPPLSPPVKTNSNINDDAANIIVEVSKVLQKSAKDISEQNNISSNINNEIFRSIKDFKKTFSLKNIVINSIIAWVLSGIGGYFIISNITNNITKINQYQMEHEAIQNLKLIHQNLDKDGKKCWNKLFK